MKAQLQRAQQGRKCRTWSCCRWCAAQFIDKIQGALESSFICYVPHGPRTRRDASECPLRNINTRSPQIVPNSLLRCSSNCRFFSPGLIHQSSPHSCVHGTVTVRSRHTWISNPPLRVVNGVQNFVMLPLVRSTIHTQDTGYGGEQLYMLRSTVTQLVAPAV